MTRSIFVYSGFIGPVIYAIVLFTLGALEPGYDPISKSMSELGAVDAPYAIVMNTIGFPLLGVFFILFSMGVHQNISSDKSSIIGPLMIALSGVFLILTGIFQCDSGCIDVTVVGETHSLFATLAAIVMIPVPLTLVPRVYYNERWRRYIWFCWVVVILTSLVSMLYMFSDFETINGLLQRLAIAGPLIWIEVTAYKIVKEVSY
ncbi:MAG: DUF998 domain-containing protein [Candidatus Thorarchaeota archaeon]